MPRYIGLSSRECFRDMALGLIDPNQVDTIISGIDIDPKSEDDIMAVVNVYQLNAWKDLPEAEKLFREFLEDGKIQQPRQYGSIPPHINHGHWIMNFTYEEEIAKKKEKGIYREPILRRNSIRKDSST